MDLKKSKQKTLEHLPFERIEVDEDHLNALFTPLGFRERIHLLYAYFHEEEVLVTSSFGANSSFLLFLLYQLHPNQPIHFIDTGFHFPETLAYKKELTEKWALQVIDLQSDVHTHERTVEGRWWEQKSDRCCAVNKVQPLEVAKSGKRVWMSGLMGFQNSFRSGLKVFQQQGDLLKFHPCIDLEESVYQEEVKGHELPRHPLEAQGYESIGCHHCTQPGKGRDGRWQGQGKTECGLHTSFFEQRPKDKTDEP